ncbi:AraC family transcriptional regulator [Gryllotalpicola protaetiae]|uniref:HTH-type transcriptional regulator RipA n=1 Tax=Gryllotalpicola protaetiae TaxID=2419771 RepID=A0A387BRT2_9MICO|nr:helix-turn-helix transcriptional regulator [Gryllotalpicola protaetiae]AYG03769.1 AraC family transcriptional regulator [Gryllotalpicola protaetiae]
MTDDPTAIVLARFPLDAGQGFDEHVHDRHQLAWVRDGVLMVTVGDRNWVLPPSLALWVPAGVRHSSSAARAAATMQGIYLPREMRADWTAPTVVAVSPLLRELIDFLVDAGASSSARAKAEALIPELLTPARTFTVSVPMPTDARAVRIAEELLLDPGDGRDLGEWGRHVGASTRTLSRIFAAETGLGFAQWRSRLRLRASLAYLAEGESVGATAMLVGFGSTSAFIAAFSELMGVTPGAYFARVVQLADQRHELAV